MPSTTQTKFGFIRTTLALWAANLFPGRAGVVTDAPVGSSTSETWGWYDGATWKYAAKRGGDEVFGSLALTGPKITFGGAADPGHAATMGLTQLSTANSVGADDDGHYIQGNTYYSGGWRAIETTDGIENLVRLLEIDKNGAVKYRSDLTARTAGAVASLVQRWGFSKQGGLGVFGATPPTSRPTVNAACTDLATCIALTNQLRTHLIACGLVQ